MRHLLTLMRPGDWVKNIFVLPALIFALPRLLADPDRAVAVALPLVGAIAGAFAAFCALASGFYCINDAVDVAEDREHPVKRRRPVASGAVSQKTAFGLGAVLMFVGIGGGFLIGEEVGLTLVLYALLQGLYNVRLKRVPFVDVVAVATGFGLRAATGALAIKVQVSVWLLLCVFFLCLYLGFIKRLFDLRSAETEPGSAWHSPAGYDNVDELNWLLGVSGVLAVMTYLMYTLSAHARSLFGARSLGLSLLTPLVLIVVHRFYRRAMHGLSDSPLQALREDRAVLASILLFIVGTLASLYVPEVERAIQGLLFIDAGSALP